MKTETKTATFASARGQEFKPAVSFDFTVNLYETVEELQAAKDELTADEQLKVRNDQRIIRARQAAQNAKLDEMGVEKQDINNNDQLRLREFYRVLMSSKKYDEATARQMASTTLGIDWATE